MNLHIDRKFEDWSIKSIEAIDTSISTYKLDYITRFSINLGTFYDELTLDHDWKEQTDPMKNWVSMDVDLPKACTTTKEDTTTYLSCEFHLYRNFVTDNI